MTDDARILLDGSSLRLEEVAQVAAGLCAVDLSEPAVAAVGRARDQVETILAEGRTAYGINTGFGNLAEVRIPPADLTRLQLNLVRSHACGVGNPLPAHEARALVLLRANVLSKGHSGIRPETLRLLMEMLNRDVVPVIPEKGSVGASGDLAPLAHLALTLVGEGECWFEGRRMPAAEALSAAELAPVTLGAKEGLALVNGTQAMAAVGTLALLRAESLATTADLAGALSLDALLGSVKPFDEKIQAVRPHPGQATVAANLRAILEGSKIVESHWDCAKVQDPYSLRCMPQVHGAARDGMAFCRGILEREVNSATDNPLLFPDVGEVISGGNFHGQYPALALDVLAMAVAELGSVSERRIEQLVNPTLSGLPPFLAPNPGLDSGFMIAQVTAAALVNENKVYCHPASVDSIPSSAGREDHVSMGMTSALKVRTVVENVRTILAIELLVAAQALEHRLPVAPGRGLRPVHARIREKVPPLTEDRTFHRDIEAVCDLVDAGLLVGAAESAVGHLA
jgi:histidine ammonia-lyase